MIFQCQCHFFGYRDTSSDGLDTRNPGFGYWKYHETRVSGTQNPGFGYPKPEFRILEVP